MTMTIFDVGMFDGADTAYYLECGHRVIAVEANPDLVGHARQKFSHQIASGQLTCVNAAISPKGEPIELVLSGADLGSSSVLVERVVDRRPIGSIKVPGVTLFELFDRYGVPHFLKVDIEGADRLCVLALTRHRHPRFLSFEAGEDVDELIEHAESIGFERFKIVNQNTFRELSNQACVYDRVTRRLMRHLGYAAPLQIRRAGRFFAAGRSSGPPPWRSDGRWYTAQHTRRRLREAAAANKLDGWYDIHAAAGSLA